MTKRAPHTVQRCDVIRQVLREEGMLTAMEIAQRMTPDLLGLGPTDPNGDQWTQARRAIQGQPLVYRLLRQLATENLVGSDRGKDARVLHWYVFVEDEVLVDQRLVDEIESIPH